MFYRNELSQDLTPAQVDSNFRELKHYFNAKVYGAHPSKTEAQNTAAFDACLAAIVANNGGVMFIPAGLYNGRINIPVVHNKPNGVINAVYIKVKGEHPPYYMFGTIGQFPMAEGGTILKTGPGTAAGGGVINVLKNELAGNYEGFSNVYLNVEDLEIRTQDNPITSGIDARYAQMMTAKNVSINTGVYSVQAALPTVDTVAGVWTPSINNAALTQLENIAVSGFRHGIVVNEHTRGDKLNLTCNVHALSFLGANHSSTFGHVTCQRNRINIRNYADHVFNIQMLNTEYPSAGQVDATNDWQLKEFDLYDPEHRAQANIDGVAYVLGGVGRDATGQFMRNGGSQVWVRKTGTKDYVNV